MLLNVALYSLILTHARSNYGVDHVIQGFVVDAGPRGCVKKINRRISSCHLPNQVFMVFDQQIIEYFFWIRSLALDQVFHAGASVNHNRFTGCGVTLQMIFFTWKTIIRHVLPFIRDNKPVQIRTTRSARGGQGRSPRSASPRCGRR